MQLGHHPGVVLTERLASVDQDPQHRQLLIVHDRPQPGHPGAHECDRVRVGGVGLAALSSGEHPGSGRQLRWHVDHLFVVGQQPVRDVAADPAAALDRPDPFGPLLHVSQHRLVAVAVGAVAAATQDGLVGGHHLDRDAAFVRIHSDDHAVHPAPPMLDPVGLVEPGGQRCFEQCKPLLSLSPLRGRRPTHAGQMRATRLSVGSRNQSDGPGAWTEAWPGAGPEAMKQAAAISVSAHARPHRCAGESVSRSMPIAR